MKWECLSNEAKSIIEWIENPLTGAREEIEIKIGKNFYRRLPMHPGDVNIPVTKELYQEILQFVIEDENIQYKQFTNGLLFKLKSE